MNVTLVPFNELFQSYIRYESIDVGTSELCSIASEFNFLLAPSRHIQVILTSLLADRQWVRSYIELNRLRLTQQYKRVKLELESIGARVRESHAGFFIWADFRVFMREVTFDEENSLLDHLFECGVFVMRGYNFGCSQPGWFRLVFTGKDSLVTEGLKRIKTALTKFTLESSCAENAEYSSITTGL
ncbi:unnamed protein product, partial [Rotaria magnacalcarata]